MIRFLIGWFLLCLCLAGCSFREAFGLGLGDGIGNGGGGVVVNPLGDLGAWLVWGGGFLAAAGFVARIALASALGPFAGLAATLATPIATAGLAAVGVGSAAIYVSNHLWLATGVAGVVWCLYHRADFRGWLGAWADFRAQSGRAYQRP